jgi:uncharacterized protein (TIGR00297 family)
MQQISDSILLTIAGTSVGLFAFLSEISARKRFVPQWLSRKVLHTFSVGLCGLMPFLLKDLNALFWIVLAAEILLLVLVGRGILFKEDSGRKSWGIALFPLPFLFLIWQFPMHPWLIAIPMIVLALSDSAAAIFGKLFSKKQFNLTGDPKSLVGSAAFFVTTCAILLLIPKLISVPHAFREDLFLLFIPLFSFLVTLSEAMGSKGTDNLFVPVSVSLLLQLFYTWDLDWITLMVLPILGLFFLWSTVRFKLLDLSGAVSAVLLGSTVVLFSGWIWIFPLAFFLFSSSLLSRIPGFRKSGIAAKEGKPRDWKQVLCNGGLYGVLSTVYSLLPTFYQGDLQFLMLVSMAVATSDTWASEIGVGMKGKVVDLLNWKKVESGISGGISFAGTVGGLLGSASIAVFFLLMMPKAHNSTFLFLIVLFLGFLGMLIDSLLGAWLQGRYISESGKILDDQQENARIIKGFRFISNDLVNLISQIIIVLICFRGIWFIKTF